MKTFLALTGAGTLVIAGGLTLLSHAVEPARDHPFARHAELAAQAAARAAEAAAVRTADTAVRPANAATREPEIAAAEIQPARLVVDAAPAQSAPAAEVVSFSEEAPKTRRTGAGCTGYKTYNPVTRTYRGFDGAIHACP